MEKDWKKITLRKVADPNAKWSITGGPFGSNLKASDYTESGIRIIQLQNIGDGEFLNEYKIYTSVEKADELLSCNIYPSEIIISKMGDPVARACRIPNYHERYVMSSDGIRLKVDESKYDSDFILYSINFKSFREEAIKNSIGSTRSRIGLDDLKNIPLLVPSLPTQQKIATILRKWDELIEKQGKLIASKEKQKKGLMQKLLTGELRFPGFEDEWEEKKLIEVCFVKGRVGWKGYRTSDLRPFGPLVLGATHIDKSNNLDLTFPVHLSVEKFMESPEIMINVNDIILVQRGSLGLLAIIEKEIGEATINPSMVILRNRGKNISQKFLYYLLCGDHVQNLIKTESSQTGVPMISQKQIGEFVLTLPEIKEQEKIAAFLSSIDRQISYENRLLKQLKIQKQGLTQQLLTGKIRVSDC